MRRMHLNLPYKVQYASHELDDQKCEKCRSSFDRSELIILKKVQVSHSTSGKLFYVSNFAMFFHKYSHSVKMKHILFFITNDVFFGISREICVYVKLKTLKTSIMNINSKLAYNYSMNQVLMTLQYTKNQRSRKSLWKNLP